MIYETVTSNPSTIFFLGFTHEGDWGLPPGVSATHTPADLCPGHCDEWDLEHPVEVKRG